MSIVYLSFLGVYQRFICCTIHRSLAFGVGTMQSFATVQRQVTVADLSKSFSCLLLFCCASLSLVLYINIAKMCTVTDFDSTSL